MDSHYGNTVPLNHRKLLMYTALCYLITPPSTGNPTVIKIVVTYYRGAQGNQNSLK